MYSIQNSRFNKLPIYAYCITQIDAFELDINFMYHNAELEIAVGHWPFSDQFAPFGQANPIC